MRGRSISRATEKGRDLASSDAGTEEVWDVPWPYGTPAAIEAGASVAAPLFAGFSSALVGIVLSTANTLRWPEAALSLLVGSAVVFLMSVQCGIWARSYSVTPSEIEEWWPGVERTKLVDIQRLHRRGYRIWEKRFRTTYRGGILLLLLGLAASLAPTGSLTAGRSAAIAIALAGFAAECLWIAANHVVGASEGWEIGGEPEQPRRPSGLQRSRLLNRAARLVIPIVRVERRPPAAPSA